MGCLVMFIALLFEQTNTFAQTLWDEFKSAGAWQNKQDHTCTQRRLISLGIHPVWSEALLLGSVES